MKQKVEQKSFQQIYILKVKLWKHDAENSLVEKRLGVKISQRLKEIKSRKSMEED